MVKNKYNLNFKDVRKLKVNREQLNKHLDLFWRNNVVNAWCISGRVGYASFWIGIYDEDAKSYKGKFKYHLTVWDDMCSYNPTEFFKADEIEFKDDMKIQEMFLEKINLLLDLGILYKEAKNDNSRNDV